MVVIAETLSTAVVISTILAIMMFWKQYNSDITVSHKKYGSGKKLNKYLLVGDVFSIIGFNIIGCYLCWSAVNTFDMPEIIETGKFHVSIFVAVLFQQLFPIILEVLLTRLTKALETFKAEK